jgi:hypothetical protein
MAGDPRDPRSTRTSGRSSTVGGPPAPPPPPPRPPAPGARTSIGADKPKLDQGRGSATKIGTASPQKQSAAPTQRTSLPAGAEKPAPHAQTRVAAPASATRVSTAQLAPRSSASATQVVGAFSTQDMAPRTESGLKPARAIGGSLNALVRQTVLYRKGVEKGAKVQEGGMSDTQKALAERTARAWRRAEPSALELEPTRVMCGGDTALEADAEHNQWVLFAFMAGVRRIEPKPAMTASDVLRLVQELVLLEASTKSIGHFRDWLDADGAEGFDVRVHTSFREAIEEIDIEEEREFGKAFAMARFEAPRSGDAVYIASRDLDMVAMRKEFEIPIEMYAAEAASAVGGLSDDDLKAIGVRCDDANAWATAEIEAVLNIPELRTAITPEHMARRVVTRLSTEADQRFLMLLTKLNSRKDPFRQAVAQALGTQEVGEIIARQLQIHEAAQVEALGQFLVLSPPGVSQAVMSGLLERASDEPVAKDAVLSLGEWYGPAQLCEWVQPQALNEESAAVLGSALAQGPSAPAELSRLVSGASAESSLVLLSALPAQALTELARPVRLLFGRAKGEQSEQVIELMIKSRAPDNVKALGDMLLEGKADKWRGRTLYALCAALVELGMGGSHVLAVAQKREANEQLRLIALDCLQRDEALVKEATRFRFTSVFESSAIKARLREIGKGKGA